MWGYPFLKLWFVILWFCVSSLFLYQATQCHTYFVIHSEGIAIEAEVVTYFYRLEVQTEAAVRAAGHRDELAVEQARVALHTLLATGIETLAQRMGWTMRCRTQRVRHTATTSNKREVAMLFVQNLSVRGGQPVPADERGVGALIDEKYSKWCERGEARGTKKSHSPYQRTGRYFC